MSKQFEQTHEHTQKIYLHMFKHKQESKNKKAMNILTIKYGNT